MNHANLADAQLLWPEGIWACLQEGLWVLDFAKDRFTVSRGFQEMLKCAKDESHMPWSSFCKLVHPNTLPALLHAFHNEVSAHGATTIELQISDSHGVYRWYKMRAVASAANGTGPAQITGTVTDIDELYTLRQEAKKAKEVAATQFGLTHDLPFATWICSAEGYMVYANKFYDTWMQVPGGCAGKHLTELFPSEYAAKYLYALEAVKATNQLVDAIEPTIREDGTQAEVYAANFPIQGPDGVLYFGGCAIDITESRKAIKAADFERADKEALINSTADLMWSVDKNFNFITGNEALLQTIVNRKGTAIKRGEPVLTEDNLPGEELEYWRDMFENALKGNTINKETFVPGTDTWFQTHMNPIIQNAEIIGVACLVRMITEEKKAIQKIEFEKADKEALINSTDDSMWSFDKNMCYITGNKAFRAIIKQTLGVDIMPGDMLLNWSRAHYSDSILWKERYESCLAGEVVSQEIHEPNSGTWMLITLYPVYKDGAVIGGTCLTKNISDIKQAQEVKEDLINELQRTNDDLRQFSYTVSHDLRAPVRNLEALLQLYNTKHLSDPENLMLIEAFKKTTLQLNDTLNSLINTLLQKEVRQKPDVSSLHFETVANSVLGLINQTIANAGASIHYDFNQAPHVIFNAAYLESIFLNLLTNSIKYTKKDVPALIDIHSEINENGAVQLIFKDNGQGFDMDLVKDRLFGLNQRFHKQKDSKGVGLYIVQKQLASLGGTITADSHVNEGATFTITFAK
jgi:PAS domain S-box-containing protein